MIWRSATKGKCGGLRVIYYWYMSDEEIYILLAYGKGVKNGKARKAEKRSEAFLPHHP